MATKDKVQKKSKLRYAEYYDFQGIQDKLYADSQKGKEFRHLVELITLPENIRLAYRNIKANHGSKTAGTDGRTIKDLERLSDEMLIALVQRKLDWYQPQSVRRVEIPKGNDPAKVRPLGIPTILDRLIQQCVLQVLEPMGKGLPSPINQKAVYTGWSKQLNCKVIRFMDYALQIWLTLMLSGDTEEILLDMGRS